MRMFFLRSACALICGALSLNSAQAEELGISDIEQRLNRIESQLSTQTGVRAAQYTGDFVVSGFANEVVGTTGYCTDTCADGSCGADPCCGNATDPCAGGWYGELQLSFLRAHVGEQAFGKMSERYQFSPRFIFGFEMDSGIGARFRYWHYGYSQNILSGISAGDVIRIQADVLDLEVTSRYRGRSTDVVLAGGFRGAKLEVDGTPTRRLMGLTMAADARTLLCCDSDSEWNWVYGGRLSILGGDWDGGGTRSRDDNIVVTELFAGFEYGCCANGYDLYTRLGLEIQNWDSDGFSTAIVPGDASKIGFIGPSFQFGVGF